MGEWLWSVDVDVIFGPDILEELLKVADPYFRPVVGALYFSGAAGDPENRWWPVWRETQGDVEYGVMQQIRIGETYENLASVGMGCTLVHRSVIEAMCIAAAPEQRGSAWFGHDSVTVQGEYLHLGEDLTFCARARKLAFPSLVWPIPLAT